MISILASLFLEHTVLLQIWMPNNITIFKVSPSHGCEQLIHQVTVHKRERSVLRLIPSKARETMTRHCRPTDNVPGHTKLSYEERLRRMNLLSPIWPTVTLKWQWRIVCRGLSFANCKLHRSAEWSVIRVTITITTYFVRSEAVLLNFITVRNEGKTNSEFTC